MFLGYYTTKLRDKNRIAFPAKFREITGDHLFITNWFDNSLIILPKNEWEKLTKDLLGERSFLLPEVRDLERFIYGGTIEVLLDHEGRFVLPKNFIEYAKIDKEIVFVGGAWYITLWDNKLYENYRDMNILQIKEKAIAAYERLRDKS